MKPYFIDSFFKGVLWSIVLLYFFALGAFVVDQIHLNRPILSCPHYDAATKPCSFASFISSPLENMFIFTVFTAGMDLIIPALIIASVLHSTKMRKYRPN
ncbi:MAG: hypothetical protein JWO73_29 [Candidatus Taylorbacteria bacterium]|nr:hypothetical protein [Candidatus Taylorbacteria bacterium]